MSNTTNKLESHLPHSLADLQTLRDEVKVRIHLASLDAKEMWAKLEPEIEAAVADPKKAAAELLGKLRQLRDSINATH